MKNFRPLAFLLLLSLLTCKQAETEKVRVTTSKTTVFVRITGLVSFVDHPEPAEEGKLRPMTMYMLNARSASPHPHQALLLYDKKYSTGKPLDQRGTQSKDDFLFFPLMGEELSFRGSEDDELRYGTKDVSCKNKDEDSIKWIPRMKNIAIDLPGGPPDHADLDIRYLFHTPATSRVAAVTDLAHGTLSVKRSTPIIWEFKTAAGAADQTLRQPTTQKVTWSFVIDDDFLMIDARPFDPVGSVKQPLLRLKADEKHEIHLTLANVVASDIRVLTAKNVFNPLDEEDPHFKKYYDILKDQTVKKRIPIAYGICDDAQGLELKGDTDAVRCLMREFVAFKTPPTCQDPPPTTVGGINCIPSQSP